MELPASEFRSAFARALGAIDRRDRTVAELRSWLAEREFSEQLIEAVVEELISIGGLDDERFAFGFAGDKRELSGWGPERIEAVLLSRGIDPGLARRAAATDDHGAQVERATALLRARGSAYEDDRARARALSFLGRRGYGYDAAYEAVRRDAESAA